MAAWVEAMGPTGPGPRNDLTVERFDGPPPPDPALADPEVRETDGRIEMWFGSEDAPALVLPPIDL